LYLLKKSNFSEGLFVTYTSFFFYSDSTLHSLYPTINGSFVEEKNV